MPHARKYTPRFQPRLLAVKELLRSTAGLPNEERLLSQQQPQQVHFLNRVSVQQHAEFVAAEIASLLRVGAIREWQSPEQPTVINGLGVVVNRLGKKRLILDARYINLFDAYNSFLYERLQDVPLLAGSQDCMMLTDFKGGYHQLFMSPCVYRFLAIEFSGRVYYFVSLPFGLSSASRVFTLLMSEVHRPLRLQGQRCTYLIDDTLFLFKLGSAARYQALIISTLLTSLGFFLSIPKCMLLPARQGKFLGLTVDLEKREFAIPTKNGYILKL